MRAVSFGAAPSTFSTVFIRCARFITIEKVGTCVRVAAPRIALKVVIASVFHDLLPVQTSLRVHTRIKRAAKGRVNAVVVVPAKNFGAHRHSPIQLKSLLEVQNGSLRI